MGCEEGKQKHKYRCAITHSPCSLIQLTTRPPTLSFVMLIVSCAAMVLEIYVTMIWLWRDREVERERRKWKTAGALVLFGESSSSSSSSFPSQIRIKSHILYRFIVVYRKIIHCGTSSVDREVPLSTFWTHNNKHKHKHKSLYAPLFIFKSIDPISCPNTISYHPRGWVVIPLKK